MSTSPQRSARAVAEAVAVAAVVAACGVAGDAATPTPTESKTYACEVAAPLGTGVTLWLYLQPAGQALGGAGDLIADRDEGGWNLDPAELSCELLEPAERMSDVVITGRDGITAFVDYAPMEGQLDGPAVTFSLDGAPVCEVGRLDTSLGIMEVNRLDEAHSFAWRDWADPVDPDGPATYKDVIRYAPGQAGWGFEDVVSTCADPQGNLAIIKVGLNIVRVL